MIAVRREWRVEVDGRRRNRNRGRTRRGAPPREHEDRLDAKLAIVELESSLRLFDLAAVADSRLRREANATAPAKLVLAARLVDQVLARRKVVRP